VDPIELKPTTWPSELEDVVRKLRAARQLEMTLTVAVTGQSSLMYRELLVWVLTEHHSGRPTSLKRCYLSLPFSEKNLRKAVKLLEDKGYIALYTADGDRRKTLILPTSALLVTLTNRAQIASRLIEQFPSNLPDDFEIAPESCAN
jgi:hypothetical protein